MEDEGLEEGGMYVEEGQCARGEMWRRGNVVERECGGEGMWWRGNVVKRECGGEGMW